MPLPNRPPPGLNLNGAVPIYNHGDRAVWTLGRRYILKRTENTAHNSEADTHDFLAERTSIPAPRVYAEWLSRNHRMHFLLEGRVPGRSLADCWSQLTHDHKLNIAEEVVRYMAELAQFRGTRMESISGKRLPNNCFNPRPLHSARDTLSGRWSTDDDIFANEFYPSLRRAGLHRSTIDLIRQTMPPCQGQLVFTHCDLYVGNVMVDPRRGRVTGIIDWESGGYWPEWFQYARITHGCSDDDAEWKEILSAYTRRVVRHAEHGRVWLDMVERFMYDPRNEQARAWLRMLMDYRRGRVSKETLLGYRNVGVPRARQRVPSARAYYTTMPNNRGGRGTEGYYSTWIGSSMEGFGERWRRYVAWIREWERQHPHRLSE